MTHNELPELLRLSLLWVEVLVGGSRSPASVLKPGGSRVGPAGRSVKVCSWNWASRGAAIKIQNENIVCDDVIAEDKEAFNI